MPARRLDHADVLSGHLTPPGPFDAWFANGEFADGADVYALSDGPHPCAVGVSRLSVTIELPPAAEVVPVPPLCVVVPRPGGLVWTTLTGLRGGPRHFVSPAGGHWMWSNRRTAYRVPLAKAVDAERAGAPLDATLLDVSIGGGRLEVPLPADEIAPGTRLRVVLPVLGEPWADAEVVRVQSGAERCTCGVRWVGLPVNVDQRLANFVFSHERAALAKMHRVVGVSPH